MLIRRIGRRGAALLFFAFLDFIYAYSLFNPPQDFRRTVTLQFVAHIAPLWLWASLWAIAGVLCLVNAFRKHDRLGFTAAIAIKVLWCSMYAIGVFYHIERAYVQAALWLAVAAWVAIISTWPEPTDPPARGTGWVSRSALWGVDGDDPQPSDPDTSIDPGPPAAEE